MPTDGGNIFASNHRSYADPYLIAMGVRVPISYMAKEELFHQNIFFTALIKAFGASPWSRGGAIPSGHRYLDRQAGERTKPCHFPRGDALEGRQGRQGQDGRGAHSGCGTDQGGARGDKLRGRKAHERERRLWCATASLSTLKELGVRCYNDRRCQEDKEGDHGFHYQFSVLNVKRM